MKKQFYSHIVEMDSIVVALNGMNLSEKEKEDLLAIIDSSLHHIVLDAILSELSEEDKKVFLNHVAADEHDKIWEFLKNKTENIEEKIKKAADDLKEKLHQDIKEVKEK